MGAMPVGCYKQMSTIKEGVTMRLQCTCCSGVRVASPGVRGASRHAAPCHAERPLNLNNTILSYDRSRSTDIILFQTGPPG